MNALPLTCIAKALALQRRATPSRLRTATENGCGGQYARGQPYLFQVTKVEALFPAALSGPGDQGEHRAEDPVR